MNHKMKTILRWIPSILLACFVTLSASFKIIGFTPLVDHFTEMGLLPYLKLFAIAELGCVTLFLIPGTFRIGLLLLTAYYGGAIAAEIPYHLIMGPAFFLALTWAAAFARNSKLFTGKKEAQNKILYI